jgi:hypothetical protein
MKLLFPAALAALLLISGCSSVSTSAKSGLDVSRLKKIAVVKFQNPFDANLERDVSDELSLQFVQRGYTVIDSSSIAAAINQNELYTAGLTPEIRSRLQGMGIDALVMGSVHESSCALQKGGTAFLASVNNSCTASVSAKMVDLSSGEMLWGMSVTDTLKGTGMTASRAVREILKTAGATIPEMVPASPVKQ